MSHEVRFPAYRRYEARRVEANNAMMALLAGAGMATQLLQLTSGSRHRLAEIFPEVPHIGRFNLRTEVARDILAAADVHLGAMSIPYTLALHDDFLRDCLLLLAAAGRCTRQEAAAANSLAAKHPLIARCTGGAFDPDRLAQLRTVRLMRNCMIHSGGVADQRLLGSTASWTPAVENGWVRFTGRSPRRLAVGDELTFGHGEMILTLAVTKVLASQANHLLQPALPRSRWADLLITDLLDTDPRVLRAPDLLRRARLLGRRHYGPLLLTDAELGAAGQRRLVRKP